MNRKWKISTRTYNKNNDEDKNKESINTNAKQQKQDGIIKKYNNKECINKNNVSDKYLLEATI